MTNRDDIIYDIIEKEVKTDLPQASGEKDYNFVFTGFDDEAYHRGNKPYVFIAKLTNKKKKEIQSHGAAIAQEADDKGVLFDWGDLIWHFDFYYDDYMKILEAGETKDGRIYFTRVDDSEIINSPGNTITEEKMTEKTKSFKKVDYKNLLTRIITNINKADAIIDGDVPPKPDPVVIPFSQLLSDARDQYDNEDKTRNEIIPDFHILIASPRWYSPHEGLPAIELTEEFEFMLGKVALNFKNTVENFSNHNVNIVPDIYIIENTSDNPIYGIGGETIDPSKPYEGNYVTFSQVAPFIKEKLTSPKYGAICFAITSDANPHVGATTLDMFKNVITEKDGEIISNQKAGFTSINLINSPEDRSRALNPEYDNVGYTYLTSSDFLLHEWTHTLESGYAASDILGGKCYNSTVSQDITVEDLKDFVYPNTHCYQNVELLSFEHQDFPSECLGNKDVEETTLIREDVTSFYKAVLSANVTITINGVSKLIGMYPKMWYLNPYTQEHGFSYESQP